jgi:hypothetical protein
MRMEPMAAFFALSMISPILELAYVGLYLIGFSRIMLGQESATSSRTGRRPRSFILAKRPRIL